MSSDLEKTDPLETAEAQHAENNDVSNYGSGIARRADDKMS
jgi:hypothetical protein